MDVHEFHKDFLEEVKATAATEGSGSNAAFVSVASSYLVNAEVLSDFTAAFYLGKSGSKKLRVDGYVLDEFDYTFNLIIADYTGDEERDTVTRTYATQQFDFLIHFIEESYGSKLYREVEPSTPASDLIEQLRFHKDRIRKFRLILLTDGFMSNRISEIEARTINDIPIECQIWDIDRIYRVCFSDLGRQDIEIDFKAYTNGKGIPCLEASSANSEDYHSYLCIIPGTVLADVYDTYGSQLLEGNVRSFLSTKVAVNKKIRETILRIPQNFFAYNNGVSATAMDLQFESTPEGKFITYARDFQIINGGQTIKIDAIDGLNELAASLRNSGVLKNHIITKTTEIAMERFKAIKQGQNFHSLDDELKTNTYTDVSRTQNTIYLRLDYDEPSGTVVNVRKSMWIHPTLDRAISVREAARLQTFPDSFVFFGTKDKQYQQVGNAVPPIMAKSIAKKLAQTLTKSLVQEKENG